MPSSPALRCPPDRGMSSDKHKRGHSFESGFLLKEKDDHLALFNEVQNQEKDNFWLQSSDDIDDAFSNKLKYFSEYKVGISVPAQGESSDLLDADGDKNDYDWLLTPPETPLFPSLDDEPAPVSVVIRGRPRNQHISISRSSTMEKSYRSSKSSLSPNRLSPSPRTGNSTLHPRGRPSSASSSSPTPSQRHVSPLRQPSPPSSKSIAPPRRSSTPTLRRMSTGSTGARGVSPVKTNRGNSASPKIRAWQSNYLGFSNEAPPNLRTSLADRPSSYVRGSSPASRTSRDSMPKYRRQSISPTASRKSASSSISHDRDHFSSHSKGSMASSGDGDLDSLSLIPVRNLDCINTDRGGVFPNNKSHILSKRPGRISSPSSAPKRSVNSAVRHMDHRKAPPNMFRPLMSSVSSTPFYVGKVSSAHRPLISRDSSVTNSSNTSSDQGIGTALDTESELNQDDLGSDNKKEQNLGVQEEIFPFERGDEFNEDLEHRNRNKSVKVHLDNLVCDLTLKSYPTGSTKPSQSGTLVAVSVSPEDLHLNDDLRAVDPVENTQVCPQCGCQYQVINMMEVNTKKCPECESQNKALIITHLNNKIGACKRTSLPLIHSSEEHKSFEEIGSLLDVHPKPHATDIFELSISQGEDSVGEEYDEKNKACSDEKLLDKRLAEGNGQRTANQKAVGQVSDDCVLPHSQINNQQLQPDNDQSDLRINASESSGISILLRSSSSKGPIVQGRTFADTSTSYDDYTHESTNSLRSSIGHSSASVLSSVDFTSVRQTESPQVQRQLSSCNSDLENYKYDLISKSLSKGSSLSGISSQSQSLGPQSSTHEENLEVSTYGMDCSTVDELRAAPQDQMLRLEETKVEKMDGSIMESKIQGEDNDKCKESRTTNPATSKLSGQALSIQLEDAAALAVSNEEACPLCDEGFMKNAKSGLGEESSAKNLESSLEEEHATANSLSEIDVSEVPNVTLVTALESEVENLCQNTFTSQIDEDFQSPDNAINEYPETQILSSTDKELVSVSEPNTSGQAHDAPEESTVLLEGHERSKTRSLTLEEATDTILFCSSIVHDLAYQAVSIAMEKENSEGIVGEPLEGFRSNIAMVEKSGSERKHPRGRSTGRQGLRSRKPKKKRLETNTKLNSIETENDENAGYSLTQNVGVPNKMDSMKPPKLESKCNCTIM